MQRVYQYLINRIWNSTLGMKPLQLRHIKSLVVILVSFVEKYSNSKLALPNPQYEQLLNCSFLPATDTASGTGLFDLFFKFCSVDKKNSVLVSCPFRSATTKESGVPVVVRQVFYLSYNMIIIWDNFFFVVQTFFWYSFSTV